MYLHRRTPDLDQTPVWIRTEGRMPRTTTRRLVLPGGRAVQPSETPAIAGIQEGYILDVQAGNAIAETLAGALPSKLNMLPRRAPRINGTRGQANIVITSP